MPEFVLNTSHSRLNARSKPHAFYQLGDFERGYVEAMFFTNGDTGSDDEFLLNRLGVARLTGEAIGSICRDCQRFMGLMMPDGRFVRQWLDRVADEYDDMQAGRDFWFTRQGHGVGFWEREQLEGVVAAELSACAKAFGEAYVEVHRGRIYHR